MTLRKRRPGLVYPVNEDWHYVGAGGEPAFQNDWGNQSGRPKMAFRIREAGVVDIQCDLVSTGLVNVTVFTLPVGYRPSVQTIVHGGGTISGTPDQSVPSWLIIDTNGEVAGGPGDVVRISSFFYLIPPDLAP